MANKFQGDWKKGHRDDAPLFFKILFSTLSIPFINAIFVNLEKKEFL